MDYHSHDEHGFLEEYPTSVPMATMNHEFHNNDSWNQLDHYYNWTDNSLLVPHSSYSEAYSNFPIDDQSLIYTSFKDELWPPAAAEFTDSSYNYYKLDTPPFPSPEDLSIMDDIEEQQGFIQNMEQIIQSGHEAPATNLSMVVFPERRNKSKKINGQPSKNLMAERRRRKRLNDRLSMLRSVVPKISKMDRTSILGDTINYMKELLERINHLQEEMEVSNSNQPSLMTIFKDSKPCELLVRNSPKFDVERRNSDINIEISCAGKPGLLLSTLTTLEALGLEIHQCVISCFNDFAVQASCSQEEEQREILSSEDVKQALFRNAGYGGSCL